MKNLLATPISVPLAEALRPQHFSQVVGQDHLTAPDAVIGNMLRTRKFASVILWGPAGCGKTTIARLMAENSACEMETLSAVTSGVADLKKLFDKAVARKQDGINTLLFVDEIHRFNRSQQDIFLPFIENGTIILVGATTENPSFELNSALLSRCRVLVLKRLDSEAMQQLLVRAEAYMQRSLGLSGEVVEMLIAMADGDGRYFLNLIEALYNLEEGSAITPENIGRILQARSPVYDKKQESHYNLISALHKSLRGSDVDAALYWLHRMLAGGEAPLYILRRLVRFAVEDIGLADPNALTQAVAAKDAFDFLGSPEGELAISQAVIYLATAPKSNAGYIAHKSARKDAEIFGSLMPPKHILNAPTKLMKNLGYGAGYQYDHDTPDAFSGQNYFPESMERKNYYQPVERGFEREIRKRLDYWEKKRSK